jgi:hypothetical protein
MERNNTDPFEWKWLRWVGPWDFTVIGGLLESDREVPDTRFLGMRFNFKPLPNLEIGLSRTALWCGDGQPCDLQAFLEVVFRGDSKGNDPDQLGGFDLRWSGKAFGRPYAVYTQWIGEDEANFVPTDWFAQFGIETWGQWDRLGTYRLLLEWADTECDFRLYRSIRSDSGPGSPNCTYNHPTYRTGYRYRGRSIGHSFDNDASVFNLTGMLIDEHDHLWMTVLAYGKLNRHGKPDPRNTVAEALTDYAEAELLHRRGIVLGEITAGLGVEYRKNRQTRDSDTDLRLYLEWRVTY